MFFLKFRMYLLVAVLFAFIYAAIVMIGSYMGINNFYFYLGLSVVMMFIQYMIGPKLVEWTMRVRYISRSENPQLFQMVEDLSMRAKIPVPRIGIAEIAIPNAFAFGRSIRDGRVCLTKGILNLLDEKELRAVLGHELSHLKNRDMITIMLLSVIPMIMYRLAWGLIYSRGRNDRGRDSNAALLGVAAFIFYFITSLLVLYASRIREYFADRGSLLLGNAPSALATSLYKLVYGSARMDKESLKEVEGLKAFFVNDPSQALNEIRELKEIDSDRSGTIDPSELERLKTKKLRLGFGDRLLETLSTHPNMLKRIKRLSEYKAY